MRPLTVFAMTLLAAVAMSGLAACGKEIGDSCTLSTDCDPDGTRDCLVDTGDPDGYCTIMGCDYDTCPSEAECVEFFMGQFANEPCNPSQLGSGSGSSYVNTCGTDEVCDLDGFCASVDSEIRYCMRKCNSDGDCRSGYECRTFNLMKQHGGQVVLPPGQVDGPTTSGFCATAPTS